MRKFIPALSTIKSLEIRSKEYAEILSCRNRYCRFPSKVLLAWHQGSEEPVVSGAVVVPNLQEED